jgi:hypothetical protein
MRKYSDFNDLLIIHFNPSTDNSVANYFPELNISNREQFS